MSAGTRNAAACTGLSLCSGNLQRVHVVDLHFAGLHKEGSGTTGTAPKVVRQPSNRTSEG